MFNLRISKRNILSLFIIVVYSLFAYSRTSWEYLVPWSFWLVNIVLAVCLTFKFVKLKKYSLSQICAALMILITLLWNNWDFKTGRYSVELALVAGLLFFINMQDNDRWIESGERLMLFQGYFFAFWTIVSYFSSDIYFNVIYPIVSPTSDYELSKQYAQGYMAGFTNHYSSNGIFLSIGICACLGWFFFAKYDEKKQRRKNYLRGLLSISVLGLALLLSGKRGPILFLVIAFVFTYFLYYSRKPITRLFKIVGLIFGVIIVIWIASLYIPAVLNVVSRFTDEIGKGDVSAGRYTLWAMGWNGFLKSPIVGNGFCWFRYNNVWGYSFHTHNVYLQWLCELGVLGSIPFFSFVIITYIHSWSIMKSIHSGKYKPTIAASRMVAISFMFETFFIFFMFTGTAFYEPQSMIPYFMCCTISEYIWKTKLNFLSVRGE